MLTVWRLREGLRRYPFFENGVFTEFSKKDKAESPTAFLKNGYGQTESAFFKKWWHAQIMQKLPSGRQVILAF